MLAFFYPDTETTIASLIVGNLINWLLHGVLTVQLYLYYLAFPNDKTWIKTAVYTVYSFETVQVIGLGIVLVAIIVGGSLSALPAFFYSYLIIADYTWAAQALLIDFVGGLVPLIAQCIYAHRIRIITRRKLMPRIIMTLAILQLFAAILTAMTPAHISMIALALWTGLNVANDLIIAFIMVRSLSKEEILSDHIRLKVIRLTHLIIATGLLTVVANSLSLVGIVFDQHSIGGIIGMPILVFMPKLYANSILVMLNNRMKITESRIGTSSTDDVSALVIADHQMESSGDEVVFLTAARSQL